MGFSWSYSRLKNFETCPKKHYHLDVARKGSPDKVTEAQSEQITWGDTVHKAIAKSLIEESPLPPTMVVYDKWIKKVQGGSGVLMVEQKYALNEKMEPTPWFGHDVWCRAIADVVRLDGPVALIIDWKTGKKQNVDECQLMLMAQCLFSHYPELKLVKAMFVWLSEGTETGVIFYRNDMLDRWAELMPRIDRMKDGFTKQVYPATPNRLCGWCPVRSCEHNPKRRSGGSLS